MIWLSFRELNPIDRDQGQAYIAYFFEQSIKRRLVSFVLSCFDVAPFPGKPNDEQQAEGLDCGDEDVVRL